MSKIEPCLIVIGNKFGPEFGNALLVIMQGQTKRNQNSLNISYKNVDLDYKLGL